MSLPLALLPVPRQRFFIIDDDGGLQPLAGGKLQFFIAGTSTPKAVYTTSDGDVELGTEVDLDADGYAPAIYVAPSGYKVVLLDAEDVQIWSQDNVEDIGAAFLDQLGVTFSAGSKDVEHGYEADADDYVVTVNEASTDPATVSLPAAATHKQDLTIKNKGTTAVAVTPDGSDTIEGLAAAFTLAAASSPTFPTITLRPDGVSNWWIVSSHGL